MWKYYKFDIPNTQLCLNIPIGVKINIGNSSHKYTVIRIDDHANFTLHGRCGSSHLARIVLDGHNSIYPWGASGICNGCIHYKSNSDVEVLR